MLSCDICGETVTSESDMKTHLLVVHMENEVVCPFCKLSGVNYDEMCFHIETAHFEQNTLERNFERINTIQYGASDHKKDNILQSRTEVSSSIHSACVCNHLKNSAQSLPKDSTLKHETFYAENLTESKKFLKSKEEQSGVTERKGSIYETVHSLPECPFCGKIEECSQDMETHVKTKHANLLGNPLEDCDQPLYDCPMCGLICTNYHILQEHVDLHLEESAFRQGMDGVQCSSGLELAHQLQQEDRKRKSEESRQEREEFQKLQELWKHFIGIIRMLPQM
uniref:Zinc finger containing ubiquitin peptidase 1 n=1 Tax=Prolemur simus TaxID=1328070 RepID=A0A8C9B540_PROSS